MVFWGRLFAFLLGLLLVLIALSIATVIFNIIPVITVQEWVTSFYLFFRLNIFFQILGLLVVVAFLGVAFFLFRFLLPSRDKTVTYATSEGEVKISFESIKALAEEALKGFSEIISTESQVEKRGNNLILSLILGVKPDTSIPELSAAVKSKVRERIERQTGIALSDIYLSVDLKKEEAI